MYYYTKEELAQIERNIDSVVNYLVEKYANNLGSDYICVPFTDGDRECRLYVKGNKEICLTVGYSTTVLNNSNEEDRMSVNLGAHLLRNWSFVKTKAERKYTELKSEKDSITFGFTL